MPIYEYVCHDCAARFERLVRRFGDAVSCPACSGAAVEKQLSVFAVASSAPAPAFERCGAGSCGGGACGLPS